VYPEANEYSGWGEIASNNGLNGIGVGIGQSGVGLKSEPGHVPLADVVIHARGLHLFVVVARMRNALAVGATISVGRISGGNAAVAVQRTPQHRERRSRGALVERKQLLVERHKLRLRRVLRSCEHIRPPTGSC